MKVYLGPYPKSPMSTFGLHQKYFRWAYPNGKHWDLSDKEYTKRDKFVEKSLDFIDDYVLWPVNFVLGRFRERDRKIDVRIDPYDTWSADHTLAHIIHPVLVQLRHTNHGAGYVDDEDVPEYLRRAAATPMTEEEEACGRVDDLHFKRWHWIMDEMIFTFDLLKKGDWDFEIYRKNGDDWSDAAFEEREKTQERINNGLRLFGKYYTGLWD